MPPACLLLSKIAFVFLSLFWFRVSFGILSFIKNALGILIGIALNVRMSLGSMIILTILVLLAEEQGMSFNFLMFFLISFFREL